MEWTKAEITQFDVSVCKLLTSYNSHHPRSSIERLYLPRRIGGRGLVSIEHLYQRHGILLSNHLLTSTDSLVQACSELISQFPPHKSVLAKAVDIVATLAVGDVFHCDPEQLKADVCTAQKNKLLECLCAKPLHGRFYTWTQLADVNVARSFHWLHGSLHSESESTIFAIQDQILCTRVYQAKIMQTSVQYIMCRKSHEHEETIQHLLSSWPDLAATSYLDQHNMVGRMLHWHLCKCFKLSVFANSW